jgi:hypothetical protein
MQPIWDYVILELPEDKKSRIVKPDNADPRKVGTLELIVLLTGPDCRNVRPGDRLVFNPEAAVIISYQNRSYYLITERATGVVVGKPRKMEKCTNGRMPA